MSILTESSDFTPKHPPPENLPSTRKSVEIVEKWMNEELQENIDENFEISVETTIQKAEVIYNIAFVELCRQDMLHCKERGKLMQHIWEKYIEMSLVKDEYVEELQTAMSEQIEQEQSLKYRIRELEMKFVVNELKK